jgi:hypothetical protein
VLVAIVATGVGFDLYRKIRRRELGRRTRSVYSWLLSVLPRVAAEDLVAFARCHGNGGLLQVLVSNAQDELLLICVVEHP